MSIRPTDPQYFQDTYDALLGAVHRSERIRELRERAAAGPAQVGGMFLGRPVPVEVGGTMGATPEGGLRRASPLRTEASELSATPPTFAFAAGLDDPRTRTTRLAASRPESPLAITGNKAANKKVRPVFLITILRFYLMHLAYHHIKLLLDP
jgi:hypothetical protein